MTHKNEQQDDSLVGRLRHGSGKAHSDPPAQAKAAEWDEDYTLEKCLGGQASNVFLAAQRDSDDRVVISFVNHAQLPHEESQSRLHRLRAGHAPGLHRPSSIGRFQGVDYLVEPYVAGIPLDEKLKTDGNCSIHQLVQNGLQLTRTLQAVHAAGNVHGRVKPNNVIVDHDRYVLVDYSKAIFGSALQIEELQPEATSRFLAPEQRSDSAERPQADIYNLGVTLATTVASTTEPLDAAFWWQRCDKTVTFRLRNLITSMMAFDPAMRPTAVVAEAVFMVLAATDAATVWSALMRIPVVQLSTSVASHPNQPSVDVCLLETRDLETSPLTIQQLRAVKDFGKRAASNRLSEQDLPISKEIGFVLYVLSSLIAERYFATPIASIDLQQSAKRAMMYDWLDREAKAIFAAAAEGKTA